MPSTVGPSLGACRPQGRCFFRPPRSDGLIAITRDKKAPHLRNLFPLLPLQEHRSTLDTLDVRLSTSPLPSFRIPALVSRFPAFPMFRFSQDFTLFQSVSKGIN